MDRSMGLFRLRLRKNNCVVQTDEEKKETSNVNIINSVCHVYSAGKFFFARHRIVLYATLNTETKWVMMKESV